jgi:hypothetical protein
MIMNRMVLSPLGMNGLPSSRMSGARIDIDANKKSLGLMANASQLSRNAICYQERVSPEIFLTDWH